MAGNYARLFKKGDWVTIRPDLMTSGEAYGVGINSVMATHAGETVRIRRIENGCYRIWEESYNWTDNMFLPPDEDSLLAAYINKNISKLEYNKRLKEFKESQTTVASDV